ncbi:MAG: hypothetical protein MZW92_57780 [Comamonadaceae bacterium]|nr:hypothetical protein [Comamonadaceae bacterium]
MSTALASDAPPRGADTDALSLQITGMSCASCVARVETRAAEGARRRATPASTWPPSSARGRAPTAASAPAALADAVRQRRLRASPLAETAAAHRRA